MDVTGIVLAGGKNLRLGRNKAIEKVGGVTLIGRVVERLQQVCGDIIIVNATTPKELPELPGTRSVTDLYAEGGPLGGIYAGLTASRTDLNIAVACDMPFLSVKLLRHMLELADGYDAVVPRLQNGMIESLHCVYKRSCIPAMKARLDSGRLKIHALLQELKVRYIEEGECQQYDSELLSFFNINRQTDLDLAALLADLGYAGQLRGDAVRWEPWE